jgi:hypothetical protein
MALRYFQGFDIHRVTTNFNFELGWENVKQDGGQTWGGPDTGYNLQEYAATGVGTGNAMNIELWAGAEIQGILDTFVSPSEIRIGFYAAARTSDNPNNDGEFIGISSSGSPFNDGFYHYGVRVNGDGGLRLHHQSTYLGSGYTANGTVSVGSWAHWEFYVNSNTGLMQLYKNGILLLEGTHPTPVLINDINDGGHIVFGQNENSENRPFDWAVDHLYVTDGETMIGAGHEVEGVCVVAAMDGYDVFDTEISGGGFRGALVIDGARYNTAYKGSTFRSEVDGSDTGHNYAQVTEHFYFTNPSTGAPWTEGTFGDISAWGVCFGNGDTLEEDVSISPLEVRLDALCLAWLDTSGTFPLVRYEPPGRTTMLSGTWRKSHAALAYFAHVNDVPRDATELSVNATSLYTSAPGCILFTRVRYPTDPDDAPLESVGVTFAEEFRTDYLDFVRVDGWGADFDSYAVAGYGVYGEGNRKFQSNYVTVNYEAVASGQAYVQGIWDYALDADTGRWSMRQLVYFLDDEGYKHMARKVVIRGHGKALQIRISSQSMKPFTINGWTVFVTANQAP